MQRRLIHNNYLDLSIVKGILLGVAYHNEELMIVMGPFALEIKLWMFKPRPKQAK